MQHAILKKPDFDSHDADALEEIIDNMVAAHPEKSGFNLLKRGNEAFAARMAIIQASKQYIALQYYVLQDDLTGKLLVEELLRAADRGIKIRLILDDLDFRRSRLSILILDDHENIEIRIFNPATTRRELWLNKLLRASRFFERYSKRMHNKALIVDGRMAVVGGRNLGDEYFDARADFAFNDLDVLVLGEVITPIQKCFESFWTSQSTFDLPALGIKMPEPRAVTIQRMALQKYYDKIAPLRTIDFKKPKEVIEQLIHERLPFSWAKAEYISDEPDKVLTPLEEADSPPMARLEDMLEKAQHEFVAVSPYFIPGDHGTEILDKLVRRGINISILTNSLASTDITAVHAAYSRYRTRLIKQGVNMFELKPLSGKRSRHSLLRKGSSRASLHAKVYVVDRKWVMIGSMNLDPRSWRRNTECMVMVQSESLAAEILEMFELITSPSTSYAVKQAKNGRKGLAWHSEETQKSEKTTISYKDPKAGIIRRFANYLFYHFAPEDQL
ncbi:MAG: phospholipase D family protein [Alphaproteobacteria bacterium]|nr:phospholipase D family protein [Alphaproteobacteria bacterium]